MMRWVFVPFLVFLISFCVTYYLYHPDGSLLLNNRAVNHTYSDYKVLSTTVYAIGVYEHSDEGDLILINIALVPGDGKIFVNVKDIEAGVTFQDYLKTVWSFVNTYTSGKLSRYDLYVHVQGNAEVVEGGSGSVMIALGVLSLLENRSLNKDFIVSGVLDDKGRIGTVMSLRKKVKFARKFGFKRFYVSEEEYDSVKDITGIKIIPVKYISEIIYKELK